MAQIIFLNYIKTAISHFNFSVAINMNLYMTLLIFDILTILMILIYSNREIAI